MEENKVSLTELYVFVHSEERNTIDGKYRNEEIRLFLLLADYMARIDELDLGSCEGISII